MNNRDSRFWPFRPQTSIVFTMILLVGLLLIYVLLKWFNMWPKIEKSEVTIIIGMLIFSLLPVLLSLLDSIIERGGVIKAGGVEIDFSNKVVGLGPSTFTVPENVGFPDYALSSSGTTDIFKAFGNITSCEVAIIDLKEGQAWWETRLLVLIAGAIRHMKPKKIVFVAKDGGINRCFQGWSHTNELLPFILKAHPQYLRSFYAAKAATRQWELVEPKNPVNTANPGECPDKPEWIKEGLSEMYSGYAFNEKGLPDELFEEKLLAWDLGMKVEAENEPVKITLSRLEELFRPVLHKESIDQKWPAKRQLSEFLDTNSDYKAITQNGQYVTMVSRMSVLNSIVRTLIETR